MRDDLFPLPDVEAACSLVVPLELQITRGHVPLTDLLCSTLQEEVDPLSDDGKDGRTFL